MKQYWLRLEQKIDALTLRERTIAFAVAALLLAVLINTVVLDPLLAKQKQFSNQVMQDQQQITALQAEIQERVKSHDVDPDAVNKARLDGLRQQSAKLRHDLAGIQQGLVSPDRMSTLLEDLLRKNKHLKLVSLRTLPVALLNEPIQHDVEAGGARKAAPAPGAQGDKSDRRAAVDAVYKHGVEIVVQGGYMDILAYLNQLEEMPWQLFWADAMFAVEKYPDARLKLTLFTLSLDKTWLNI